MERIPVELLYLLGLVGFLLFNFIAQRAARRRQQRRHAEAPVPSAEPPSDDKVLQNLWGRTRMPAPAAPALVARSAPPPAPAQPATARRVHPVRALLKDRRDLRRAVVLAMVLGPCRAQERVER